MSGMANHYRERAVALLTTLHDAERGARLAAYGPAAEAQEFTRHLDRHRELSEQTRMAVCREELDGLRVAEDIILLSEIHPAWLKQVLEKESPLIVGLLLRYLPSRHVRYLMDHLPASVRQHLPQLLDTFAVAPEILRLVRRRFESHFVPVRPSKPIERFQSADVCHLRAEELETLLHDLGIHELALALRDMDRQGIYIIFNRLEFRDAKALKERIEALRREEPALERDAKYTIFEIGAIADGGAEAALKEIGVHALAKAMHAVDAKSIAILRQKLPPHFGYLLTRTTEHYAKRMHPAIAAHRHALICERVIALSTAGALDAHWKHLATEHAPAEHLPAIRVPEPAAKELDASLGV